MEPLFVISMVILGWLILGFIGARMLVKACSFANVAPPEPLTCVALTFLGIALFISAGVMYVSELPGAYEFKFLKKLYGFKD